MSTLVGIQIGDNHADEVNPISRIDNYNEAFFRKLEEIRYIVEKNQVDFSLWTADWFHKKDPWRVSHRLVNRMRDVLLSFPKNHKKFSLVGNHDITADNIETLDKQPIQGLFSTGALTRLSIQDQIMERGQLRIQISGADYSPFLDSKEKSGYNMDRKDVDFGIKLVHGFLLKPTEEWYVKGVEEGYTRMNDICHYNFDVLFHGHRHDDVGLVMVGGKPFINYGSMMRGSIAEMNISRTPKIALFHINKEGNGKVEFSCKDVCLTTAEPAAKVFDLEALKEQKEKDETIKEFVDKLGHEVGAISDFDLLSLVDKLEIFKDIPEHYRRKAKYYLEKAQTA